MKKSANRPHRGKPPRRKRKPAQAQTWVELENNLAAALRSLEDDSLVIGVKGSSRYVQFANQSDYGLRAETVSNAHLAPAEQLDPARLKALTALGWLQPTHADRGNLKWPAGSPNFFHDFLNPPDCAAAAKLVLRTLAEILDVPNPNRLEYTAFDERGRPVLLPALGLGGAPQAKPPRRELELSRLRSQVLAAMRRITHDTELALDEDGDVPVPLRVFDEPRFVRVYCGLVPDLGDDEGILRRVHEINAGLPLARLLVLHGSVFIALDVPASPLVAAHVVQACALVQNIADEVSRELTDGPDDEEAGPSGEVTS